MVCLYIPDKGRFVARMAKLDTGSEVNVMSKAVYNVLDMKMEVYDGPPIKGFGNTYTKPLGQVKVDWRVSRKYKTYTSQFVVFDDSLTEDFDVLLGDNTIKRVGFFKRNHAVWILR